MNRPTLLPAALYYHTLGFLVVPLCPPALNSKGCLQHSPTYPHPGKVPLIKWGGLSQVTEASIEKWWGRWANANIGALLGDGIVVLDIDPRNGGWETIAKLGLGRPHTPTNLTGGGGEHWFFSTGGREIASRTLGPGVELLGRGKIAVLPPSLHASGRRYEWEVGFALSEVRPAPLPASLLNGTRPRSTGSVTQAFDPHRGTEDVSPAVRKALAQRLLARGGALQKDGRILAPCPFPEHQEKDASFYFSPISGRWWCFGAGHPGRPDGAACASGDAYALLRALQGSGSSVLRSVTIVDTGSIGSRSQHMFSLEEVEEVYARMREKLEARVKAKDWKTIGELEGLNALRQTLETVVEAIKTDRRPGGVRIPCLKDGLQAYVHVVPQGCGSPFCPIHSWARAWENIRPKLKRLMRIKRPAFVMFGSREEGPRSVAAKQQALERRQGYPLKKRAWYKLVLPLHPGAMVGLLVDLADGEVDFQWLAQHWSGEIQLVVLVEREEEASQVPISAQLPQRVSMRAVVKRLPEALQEAIRSVDFVGDYSDGDEEYWLEWLLETRRLQCARPVGAARRGTAADSNHDEVDWEKPVELCPHGNHWGKPLGILTPHQIEFGLARGLLEETPFGLIEIEELPPDWKGPPGIHKFRDRAIKRRREREAIAAKAAIAAGA